MFQRRAASPARFLVALPVLALLVLGLPREPDHQTGLVLAQSLEQDQCAGDEVMSFAPSAPLAEEDLLIAVSSSRWHRGVWLAGSERAVFLREYEGRLGWVGNWLVVPSYAGPLRLQFYIDSTILCTEATILVGPSARPQPAELPTKTPTPTVTRDDDGDNGDNSGDNTADNESPQVGSPKFSSVEPTTTCAGDKLAIRGRGFGSSRADVDGKVVVSGSQVRDYLSWEPDEVVVLVPNGASIGLSREVYLITQGGFARATVDVVPCSGDNAADNDSPQIGSPTISSVDPTATCSGRRLTLRGHDFGSSRADVDGKVIISGAEVRDYLSWKDGEVGVLVPNGAAIGPGREVYLITAGGFARTTVDVAAEPC